MIPSWWGEFSSISIFGSGLRFGPVVAVSTSGGFGGGLTLGGMIIGGIRAPRGIAMPFGGCWTVHAEWHFRILFLFSFDW